MGRFRADSAVYPDHIRRQAPPSLRCIIRSASIEVETRNPETFPDEPRSICAFCLITSAGVMMTHEASSAVADARAWMSGCGIVRAEWARRDAPWP
ncbi:hypothetical protein P8C59_006737 [Phyllachora maydis]|uniref:Uncharacterized protein n=1 Tax=Phyllachora maydis TaxID=1825666 RepID=A0AAD9I894_9PEZI|nr:hypothetical protein P8C59_006737 [Phyllachora maydis]